MVLKEIQDEVDKWAQQFETPYWTPHQIYARLGEEVGELAREINNLYGPKKKKESEEKGELGDEISDIIFTLCCLANSQNINLDEHWKKLNDEKCYKRDNDRYKKK